jgi:hypothetical protein
MVTNLTTGAPIPGASVYALGGGNNYGDVTTDSSGHFERLLAPGHYILDAHAEGYYDGNFDDPPGSNNGAEVEVSGNGPNVFDTTLVPATGPYLGVGEANLTWSHVPHEAFASMVLRVNYGGYADTPTEWPADELVVQVVDAAGTVVESTMGNLAGGGGVANGFTVGSATGCGFFGTSTQDVDPTRLRVVVFLRSNPAQAVTAPVVPNMAECGQTELNVRYNAKNVSRKHAPVAVEVLNRAPGATGIAGTLTFTVAHRKALTVRVQAQSDSVSENLARLLRRGRNQVEITFAPADASFSAPPPRVIVLRVKGPR